MKAIFVNKKKEAADIFSFYFKSSVKLFYLPGQYIYITLPFLVFSDKKGATRHFTISQYTTGDLLRITTKIRKESAFKQTLLELKTGTEVDITGPSGTFIIDEHEMGEQIFVAGGIGITPFIAVLDYAIINNRGIKAKLLYSCSSIKEIAFIENFHEYKKLLNHFEYNITITDPALQTGEWTGLMGRIDARMLTKISKNLELSKYWLSGPPAMTDAVKKLLEIDLHIAKKIIVFEEFTGY